jgi:hypothetical protein
MELFPRYISRGPGNHTYNVYPYAFKKIIVSNLLAKCNYNTMHYTQWLPFVSKYDTIFCEL